MLSSTASTATLDRTFAALADPTRRAMVARLARAAATVGELAEPFPVTAPAITKHVQVLERAGLLTRERRGRYQVCRLAPGALDPAVEWLERHREFWHTQLGSLVEHLGSAESSPRPSDPEAGESR